ncbi:MAG: hypothetical protein ABL964_06290 [Steroidobacteraceae bacterium]
MSPADLGQALRSMQDWPVVQAIGQNAYAFPLLDAAHILFQAFVVGSIAALDLRLLGYALMKRPVSELVQRILPWTWIAFGGATVTGVVLFVLNVVRFVDNRAFMIKMLLMVLAGANMLAFHKGVYRTVGTWDLQSPPPRGARIAGALSLVLWIGVVFFGRYLWYPWSSSAGF